MARFDGAQWLAPIGWSTFTLDDFEAHACSRECRERVLTTSNELTPVTDGAQGIPIT